MIEELLMNYKSSNEMIEEYRGIFAENIKNVMEQNGNDLEDAQLVLESALDFAISDLMNTIYK